MALSQAETEEAQLNAENRYLSEGGEATDRSQMGLDPEFQRIHQEEIAFIENRHIEQESQEQQQDSMRQDNPTDPCSTPEDNQTVNCYFDTLTVNKTGDSNRIYRSNGRDEAVLELVAGHTEAKATIECVLAGVDASSCPMHNQRVWNISPAITGADLSKNNRLDLDLLWKGDRSTLGFFNQSASPTIYRISSNTHNNSKDIEVRVYPDHAWEGTVNVAFRLEEATQRILYDGSGIQLSRTDDGFTRQFGGRINDVLEILSRYLNLIFEIKSISQTVTAGAVNWGLVPPNFTFALNSKWQENTTNLRCGYYYNGRLAFDPLVGIQLVVNLGILAIQAIPYIGRLVAQMAGDEITRYVAITFTLQGTLGVDVSYSKNAEEESGSLSGGATGRISFDIQIRAQFNRDLYFVTVNCGVRAGSRGSATASIRGPLIDRSGSYASLDATFDGLSVYAAAYGRVGASQTTTQRTPGRGLTGDYNNPDGNYQVRETGNTLAGETQTEEAGSDAEEVYPWIDPRPLGSVRINL